MDREDLQLLFKSLLECSRGRLSKADCLKELTRFKDMVRSMNFRQDKQARDTFIEQHYSILSSIKFELEYLIKERAMQPAHDIVRLRDRIYADLLRDVHIQNEMQKVTSVFNDFMKGITFFGNQAPNAGQPVYHRPGHSCPSRGAGNEACLPTNTASTRMAKAKRVRMCYIERLVYDELWSKMMFSPQDMRHVEWLGETKKAFSTCFPDRDIFVELQMTEGMTDEKVPITLKVFDGSIIEVYEKSYSMMNRTYGPIVCCYQYHEEDDAAVKYKESTFDAEGTWKVRTSSIDVP